MRAAVFREVGRPLEIVDRADLTPSDREVVLKVGRCGICGSDLHMTEPGGMAPDAGTVIGHEIAGEVVAVGHGVSKLKIGDRVAALPIVGCGSCIACLSGEPAWCATGLRYLGGGYAQYALAGEDECLVLPSGLSFTDGALIEPLAVALHGVRMAPGLSASSVRIIGAGPIGLAATYWARRFGASRIEVAETNPKRAEMAMAMGAHFAGPPDVTDPFAMRRPQPDAPEFVFECVGKPGLLAAAVSHVRPRGTVVSLGFCMRAEQFVAALAAMREATIKFPVLYTIDDYRASIDALSSGAVEPRQMVTDVVGLDLLPERFESLRKPSHHCKVMIDPWADAAV